MYPETVQNNKAGRTVLLVEDANSGFQFFCRSAQGIECLSASGNGNVFSSLMALKDKSPIAVIADGAAFGAFIESVLSISEARKDVSLFLPESFEWLILKSGVIGDSSIKDILDAPEDYIDSSEYFSWERFFYLLLESKTRDNKYMHYSKTELPEFYVTEKNKQQILKTLPEQLQRLLQSKT